MNAVTTFQKDIKKYLFECHSYLNQRLQYIPTFSKLALYYNRKENIRATLLKQEGITVPPVVIISVTNECNLDCVGCYANAWDRDQNMEMDIETIENLVSEARKLGVFTIMFAGGEPLMKHGLLDLMGRHKDMLFVFFTNGLLMDTNVRKALNKMHHVVPAISLEGTREMTDKRRGRGVYDATIKTLKALDHDRLLFGTSITLTRENYDTVVNTDYLYSLETKGCRVVFLIEYVPCNGDTEMCLSSEQKADYLSKIPVLRQHCNMLIVSLPGDESKYNGCLAAGRGFIHISSTGFVEACPFAPYADVNVKDTTLQQALKSQLLSNIRANHHLLEEANGGCTLFENKAWVESLTRSPKGKINCNALI